MQHPPDSLANHRDLLSTICRSWYNHETTLTDCPWAISFEYEGGGDSGDIYSQPWISEEVDEGQYETTLIWFLEDGIFKIPRNNTGTLVEDFFDSELFVEITDNSSQQREFELRGNWNSHLLVRALRETAYELLPGGWEVNDGSYGTIHFYIDTDGEIAYRIDHNWRVSDTTYESYSGVVGHEPPNQHRIYVDPGVTNPGGTGGFAPEGSGSPPQVIQGDPEASARPLTGFAPEEIDD